MAIRVSGWVFLCVCVCVFGQEQGPGEVGG